MRSAGLLLLFAAGLAGAETPPPDVDATIVQQLDALPALPADAGWERLDTGTDLAGWRAADMTFWTVEEGAITARITPEHPTERNHYLVWQGGELADFELKLRHRILSQHDVNGGFQFRSQMFNSGIPDDCRGYQVDNNTNTTWLARLYDEFGRHTLAWRGEHSTFAHEGSAHTIEPLPGHGEPARFKLEDWHEYHLVCKGREISLSVNGRLIAKVTDNDPFAYDLSGILALQLHSGPPMVVQFKEIWLRRLHGDEAADAKQ